MIDWNRVHRLVGSSEPRFIVEKLILDSLLFLKVLPSLCGSVLDLGSGAGLPGIPLKVVASWIDLTMLESKRRRASFLSTVVRELVLEGARVVYGRAEDSVVQMAASFDVVVMRSVGRVGRVMPMALKFVRLGGTVVISGPPKPTAQETGQWVTVNGLKPEEDRHFLVYRHY